MPFYPTIYENSEGKITRGPDLTAVHWTVAMDELHELVRSGNLPDNVRMVGEYKFAGVPWPPDTALDWRK